MDAAVNEQLNTKEVKIDDRYRCCVVMASDGYPLDYEKGKEITGINDVAEDTLVFHAGTKTQDGKLYSDGGRVLSVVGVGNTLQDSIKNTYSELKKIDFDNKYFRSDIGTKGLKYIG